jgi:hypothetical protein
MKKIVLLFLMLTGCTGWEVVESDDCCGGHIHHYHTRTVYVVDDHDHHYRRRGKVIEPTPSKISRPTPPSRPLPVNGKPRKSPVESRKPTKPRDP